MKVPLFYGQAGMRLRGFWQCMDAFKCKQCLEELDQGHTSWKVLKRIPTVASKQAASIGDSA
jgi:hypothetical protein